MLLFQQVAEAYGGPYLFCCNPFFFVLAQILNFLFRQWRYQALQWTQCLMCPYINTDGIIT